VERTGILLAVVVALCWGGADTVATFAARRQGTSITTSISLVVSAAVLVIFGVLPFAQTGLSLSHLLEGIGIGILTGIMAAIGYFSLYRGLELGPLAIVSPVAAADGAVGAVLAVFLLHEHLSLWQIVMLVLIFLGVLCASTNFAEVRGIIRTSGFAGLAKGGVRWGLLAMITFGVMLFGIGLAAGKYGWYTPILWTRTFAAFALLLFLVSWRRSRPSLSTRDDNTREEKTVYASAVGTGLAVVVGILETVGLLLYSFDTQLTSTGLAAAISSSWGIIPLLAGITIFRERPTSYQLFGVLIVLVGLFLLSIKPS
jgi:drug/metabolite transporter (DMT)-like permease